MQRTNKCLISLWVRPQDEADRIGALRYRSRRSNHLLAPTSLLYFCHAVHIMFCYPLYFVIVHVTYHAARNSLLYFFTGMERQVDIRSYAPRTRRNSSRRAHRAFRQCGVRRVEFSVLNWTRHLRSRSHAGAARRYEASPRDEQSCSNRSSRLLSLVYR